MAQWADIPGFEGLYQISTHGTVLSVGGPDIRIKKASPNINGYMKIKLSGATYDVHRLVALTFLGPPPAPDCVVNHINHNKGDNRLTNLAWVSRAENSRHAARSGRGKVSITPDQVADVRTLYATGKYTQREIASIIGVARGTISDILTGRTWSHVQ